MISGVGHRFSMSRTLTLALCFLLGGCQTLPEASQEPNQALPPFKPMASEDIMARHALLVGRWYGEATTREGRTRRWLRENMEDGRYRLSIRDYLPNGRVLQQVESGRWGLSGTIYFTLMEEWQQGNKSRASDPANPYNHDAYEILHIDERRLRLRHQESRQHLVMDRVDEGFRLPGRAP